MIRSKFKSAANSEWQQGEGGPAKYASAVPQASSKLTRIFYGGFLPASADILN